MATGFRFVHEPHKPQNQQRRDGIVFLEKLKQYYTKRG